MGPLRREGEVTDDHQGLDQEDPESDADVREPELLSCHTLGVAPECVFEQILLGRVHSRICPSRVIPSSYRPTGSAALRTSGVTGNPQSMARSRSSSASAGSGRSWTGSVVPVRMVAMMTTRATARKTAEPRSAAATSWARFH